MDFREQIRAALPRPDEVSSRRWVYVPYDQLTTAVGPLAAADPSTHGVVMLESRARPRERPYHRKKLALVLSNVRHFALELAARGFRVIYRGGDAGFAELLRDTIARHGLAGVSVMEPAERGLRDGLATVEGLAVVPNETWATTADDFREGAGDAPPWRMDAFYRHVRRRTGLLMRGDRPEGGRFSHDGDNRLPWRGDPPAPSRYAVAPDAITREVLDLVAARFPGAWGALDGFDLPCSADDAEALWQHALRHALPMFGPYEDAMSAAEPALFHSLVSAPLNLSRLLPRRLIDDVVAAHRAGAIGLASTEGFVRQVLGWREFVRHVHRETRGFTSVEATGAPDFLAAGEPLPAAYLGEAPSGLRCLDTVVNRVWQSGHSHHIERLMVLANLATLIGVSPRALTDWFWFAYVDAYDWVVEPNVLAMGTFAVGDLMTTKPYVSGAAYLHRMSDFCRGCRFDPTGKNAARACPVTPMYWDFLARNADRLRTNERMRVPLAALTRRSAAQRTADAQVTAAVREALRAGRPV